MGDKLLRASLLRGAGGRGIRFGAATRAKIVIQGAVRGVENDVAIVALAQVLLNLAFYRRREFPL